MSKVLVSDPIDQAGIDILSQVAQVDVKTGLPPEELVKIIGEYDAIMIRSETRVTKEIIEAATKLKIIGRAGVGVDNVDIPAATRKGIVVVNSPEGNTIAAAEHALAMMLSMARFIPEANKSMKEGQWNRKLFVGTEVYKKTLGVVGLGKIGSHVATVAKAMGMKLLAYDPFISVERAEELGCRLVDLDTIFRESDYITLHIPKTPETANLINAETLAKMKSNARIINCARGGIIDEAALAAALKAAGVDNIDYYTAEIVDEKSGTHFTTHVAFNIVGTIAAADLKNSIISGDQTPMIAGSFDSLAIDVEKAKGAKLFRLAESVMGIVVHASVKKIIEDAGIDTLTFVAPAEWVS